MTSKTYRYEQVIFYEIARDLLNSHVADCSAELGMEWAKQKPNMKRIEEIEAIQRGIIADRNAMRMTDDQAMDTTVVNYRRTSRNSVAQHPA